MDIVWQASDNTVSFWLLNGVSTGIEVTVTRNPMSQVVGIGDFNHDGCSDVLFQTEGGTVGMWLMGSIDATDVLGPKIINGADATTGVIEIGPYAPVVGVGDFDGNGKSDFVTQDESGVIQIVAMNGSTVLGSSTVTAPGPDWKVEGVADFNNDGMADILVRHINGSVAVIQTGGSTIFAGPNPGIQDWEITCPADLDGDHQAEIVWRTGGLQNGDGGQWIPVFWFVNSTPPEDVQARTWIGNVGVIALTTEIVGAADFDGDGKDDLVFYETNTMNLIIVTMDSNAATRAYNFGGHIDQSHGPTEIVGIGKFYKLTVVLVQ